MRGYHDEPRKRLEDPRKQTAENYCYECGVAIDDDKHFCDHSCADKFCERYSSSYAAKRGLERITRSRQKKGIPYKSRLSEEV
jgi:hypothetical protein